MYCRYCGKEIADESLFCKYCGTGLSDRPAPKPFNKLLIIIPALILVIGIAACILFYIVRTGDDANDATPKAGVEEPADDPVSASPNPETASNKKSLKEEIKPKTEEVPKEDKEETSEPRYVEKKLHIKTASASSYLAVKSKDGQTYEPEHLIDGDYTTAWLEGTDDLGIGESVTLYLGDTDRITRLLIYNGFMNTKYRYAVNGQVTRLLVEFGDGTSKTVDVNTMSVPEEKVLFDKSELNPTEIILDEPVSASTVKLTILDAIPGSKYKDVALSEIEVFHEVDEKEAETDDSKINDETVSAYSDYFRKNFSSNEYGGYEVAFVYLDEDTMPELLVRAQFDMGEVTVLQYADGKIYDLGNFVTLEYIPHKNDIIDTWCDGETSEEIRMRLTDHRLVTVGGVSSTYWDENTMKYYVIDKNDNRIETTKDEYDAYFVKKGSAGTYILSDQERFYPSVEDAFDNM